MLWASIVILLGLVTIIFVDVARERLDPLSMPFVVAGVFAFLYLWMPVSGLLQGGLLDFVTTSQAAWGILFPALSLAAFTLGWFAVTSRRATWLAAAPTPVAVDAQALKRVYRAGFGLCLFGMALWCYFLVFSGGIYHFYSGVHGRHGEWTGTTAWVYGGLLYTYAGLGYIIIAWIEDPSRPRQVIQAVFLLSAALYAHAILVAARGSFFILTMIIVGSVLIAARKRPGPKAVFASAAFLGIILFVLVGYRSALHLGTSREEFRNTQFYNATGLREYSSDAGHEFVYHTGVLTTVDQLHKYGWGKKYFWYLTLHPIPRIVWPSKPYHYGTHVTSDEVRRVMGWTVASGASAALVADFYRQWGPLSGFAWVLLGGVLGLLYRMATRPDAVPFHRLVYVLVLAGSLHLVAQGFLAFLESFLIEIVSSYLVWKVYVRWPRNSEYALWYQEAPDCQWL